MTLPESLALLNACFNASAAALLVLAYRAIRAGDRERHKRLMLGACGVSALFLVSYTTRMYLAGDTLFQGEGAVRLVYFGILISHVLLAMAIVPLVPLTLYHALGGGFLKHRRIARITLPVWLYVSVTGVVVYLMLYHYPA